MNLSAILQLIEFNEKRYKTILFGVKIRSLSSASSGVASHHISKSTGTKEKKKLYFFAAIYIKSAIHMESMHVC